MNYDYFEDRPHIVQEEHKRRVDKQVAVRRNLRDHSNPFEMSVTEFQRLYRMQQHLLLDLVQVLREFMQPRTNMKEVAIEIKVLCAIGFFACGGYQRHFGRESDINLSHTMVSRCIEEVVQAFNHPNVLSRYVKFPVTEEERQSTIAINDALGMPRTVGYIDGTLIKIVPPPKAENQQMYRSREGYTALNVQIVCNANLYIMHVNARFPGSTNDSYIYRASPVLPVMRNAYQQDPCWLLGDSGYPLQPWLMLPLPHAERGTPEFHYTKLHCHSRNCVERCIGVLKARWRCLLTDRTMHYKPEKCGRIVNACVVLHNYLTQLRAPEPGPILEQLGNDPAEEDFEEDWHLLLEANEVRRRLIQHAHARWLQMHQDD